MNHQNTAAEAKYSKFLDHPNGSVAYTVLHPSLSENQLDLEVRRAYIQGHSCWVCAEPSGAFRAVASTRKGAVELSLKQVALYLEGKQAEDFHYAEMDRVNDGSTAWHALLSGRENADDTVNEGMLVAGSPEYWILARSSYQSLMDELSPVERGFADRYNLIDMARCTSCGEPIVGEATLTGVCADCQLKAEGNECDICHEFFAESLTDCLCQKCLVLVEAEEADNAAYLEDWKDRTGCLDAPVKGAWMREPDNTYAYYEVVAVAADGQSCQVWHHGPILTVTLKRDGLWWFNETPVAFYSKRALV